LLKDIYSNIYIDPLTGFHNFFGFIQSDVDSVFGKFGSALILDVAKFSELVRINGKITGDACLKVFSDVIRASIQNKNISAFRTDCDEFTLILPHMSRYEAEKLSSSIRNDYLKRMQDNGFNEIDIRTMLIEYSDDISSIAQFYQLIYKSTLEKLKECNSDTINYSWLEHIIGSLTRRIKETLSFYKDAYDMALTDDISTLPNQRAARLYLSKLVHNDVENRKKFSILFIDGDNLRKYNEISYEHGNEMIRKLSEIISGTLRKEDKIFRWLSGDEFVIILDNVGYGEAVVLAERIRNEVEEKTRDWEHPITVSIGISSYPDDDLDIDQIINKAEKANFYAKKFGKNKVISWNSTIA